MRMGHDTGQGFDADSGARAPQGPRVSSHAAEASNLLVGLSLNLMLLAFMAVLASAASFDRQRVAVAMSALRETFASGPEITQDGELTARTRAETSLREAITTTFAAVLPNHQVVVPDAAARIDVDVPAAALFEWPTFTLRPALPVLDRVVTLIAGAPPGFRFELILSSLSSDEDPAVAAVRADAVAQSLVRRGAATELIYAGAAGDRPRRAPVIVFSFLVLDSDEETPVVRYAGPGAAP
jgi:hypothetical protein